jgi:hypothetical protein
MEVTPVTTLVSAISVLLAAVESVTPVGVPLPSAKVMVSDVDAEVGGGVGTEVGEPVPDVGTEVSNTDVGGVQMWAKRSPR